MSDGRLVLGVGIGGGPWEWDYLGEEPDPAVRGAMFDEGLALLTRLWTGEPVLHEGRFYRFRGDLGPGRPAVAPTPLLPPPVQAPPTQIGMRGAWPRRPPFRRAARWDGVFPRAEGTGFGEYIVPEAVRAVVAYVRQHRASGAPFDVVVSGHTAGKVRSRDVAVVAPYAEAGATWWVEDISPWPFGWNWQGPWPFTAMQERIG